MVFHLEGRIKPAVRTTGKKMFTDKQFHEYQACKDGIKRQVDNQMSLEGWDTLPAKTTMYCFILFYRDNPFYNSDLDNMAKTIWDALNGHVYPDDRYIDWAMNIRKPGGEQTFVVVGECDSVDLLLPPREVTEFLAGHRMRGTR